jgi:hypothetical protein
VRLTPIVTSATNLRRRIFGRLLWDVAALIVFAIAAAILAYPLFAGGFTTFSFASNGSPDPQIFIWGLAWYPYALTHGLDPLFTTMAFAPSGYNLAWSTTLPAPALVLWPLTRYLGPLFSFNLLSVLVPVLSAYTAFALCRHLTKAPLASIAGGLVYGFSTYQRIQVAHLNLALSFIPPLLALLFLLRMETRIGALRYALLLALCLIFQFLISPEIFTTSILFGAIAIGLCAWLGGQDLRTRLRITVRESFAAIALAVILLSPYLIRFIPSPFGISPIYNPAHCSSDLLGFVMPTLASLAGHFKIVRLLASPIGFGCEPAAYFGLLPLIVIGLVLSPRPQPAAFAYERFLALMLTGIIVLSLGPVIHVAGTALAPSIWLAALFFPIVNNALPARFVLYAFLVLGVMTALWLSDLRRGAATRWMVAAVAVLSVLPAPVPAADATLPFFNQRIYRTRLSPNETVMYLPFAYNGEAMKWQAQTDFYFRVAGGYLSVIPREYAAWPIVPALLAEEPYIPGYTDQFLAFLAAHRVTAVIVPERDYAGYAKLCATLAATPERVGGVVVFRLKPATLAPFSNATAAQMDTLYEIARFEILLGAARDYLAKGYPWRDLSPFAAVRLGLLDATVAGTPARLQTSGFPFVRAARGSAAFQAIARFMVAHQMIRERLAVELGPLPATHATTSGIWLGPWSDGSIALGVTASPPAAAHVIARFGARADTIYYPYPMPYRARPDSSDDSQMLLMTFKPATLRTLH